MQAQEIPQYLRPTKILWVFPKPNEGQSWTEKIPSKSLKKQAQRVDALFEQNNIVFTQKLLSLEEYVDWLRYYEHIMKSQDHDVIAKPDWFEKKHDVLKTIWLLDFCEKESGRRLGGSIVSESFDGTFTHHFKASERIYVSGLSNASLGSLMELKYLQFAFSHDPNKVTSGLSRNAFGYYNTIGYLLSKLKIGYLPFPYQDYPYDSEFLRKDSSTNIAWIVIAEDVISLLLFPTIEKFEAVLFTYLDRLHIPYALLSEIQTQEKDDQKLISANIVRATYFRNLRFLHPYNKFHFLTRLWLLRKDKDAMDVLQLMFKEYLENKSPEQQWDFLRLCLTSYKVPQSEDRKYFLQKYPELRSFARDAFIVLFAKKIWNLDLYSQFSQKTDKKKIQELFNTLLPDTTAITVLATYALNFLVLATDFFQILPERELIEKLYKIQEENWGKSLAQQNGLQLLVYFFTHVVINDTLFYTRPIPKEHLALHQQMLQKIEKELMKNTEKVSVDCLCEFIVVSQMLGMETALKERILKKITVISDAGDIYLAELDNQDQNLSEAEHTNVLFICGFL